MRPTGPTLSFRSFWLLAAACALSTGGCREERWQADAGMRAPDYAVAAALGDTYGPRGQTSATDIPDLTMPTKLRPCCAFGADLGVAVGQVAVPGIELGNIVDWKDLGYHRYNPALVGLDRTDTRAVAKVENNGLVYTCRGGFIDIAHVRDNADLTLYLTAQIARTMDTGGVIPLASQGAQLDVRVHPISAAAIDKYGRGNLAVAAAQWAAFQGSIWHEIATWYGYHSVAGWPEKISAFSPEDLYSNLLGIKIAGGVISRHQADNNDSYNRAMDAWIPRAIERLQVQNEAESKAAMYSVDGVWWDSEKRVPDWQLTKRRKMDIGSEIHPWLVAQASEPGRGPRFSKCPKDVVPLVLRNPDGFEGTPFDEYFAYEVEIGDELVAAGFPLPYDGSRYVTQADFPAIIAQIRRENAKEMGANADRP